eukprot:Hpha_TRINITY_DN16756_c1_g2::TRINITY_DN16756_c1_g2_i4::g.78901::m.78901
MGTSGSGSGGTVEGKTCSEEDCYIESLNLNPKYSRAWNNLGTRGGGTVVETLYSGRVIEKSYTKKECYIKALTLNPKRSPPWINLGREGGGTVRGRTYSATECYSEALTFGRAEAGTLRFGAIADVQYADLDDQCN